MRPNGALGPWISGKLLQRVRHQYAQPGGPPPPGVTPALLQGQAQLEHPQPHSETPTIEAKPNTRASTPPSNPHQELKPLDSLDSPITGRAEIEDREVAFLRSIIPGGHPTRRGGGGVTHPRHSKAPILQSNNKTAPSDQVKASKIGYASKCI